MDPIIGNVATPRSPWVGPTPVYDPLHDFRMKGVKIPLRDTRTWDGYLDSVMEREYPGMEDLDVVLSSYLEHLASQKAEKEATDALAARRQQGEWFSEPVAGPLPHQQGWGDRMGQVAQNALQPVPEGAWDDPAVAAKAAEWATNIGVPAITMPPGTKDAISEALALAKEFLVEKGVPKGGFTGAAASRLEAEAVKDAAGSGLLDPIKVGDLSGGELAELSMKRRALGGGPLQSRDLMMSPYNQAHIAYGRLMESGMAPSDVADMIERTLVPSGRTGRPGFLPNLSRNAGEHNPLFLNWGPAIKPGQREFDQAILDLRNDPAFLATIYRRATLRR